MDAKLKKWTSAVAVMFLICSIVLSFLVSKQPATGTDESGTSIPLEQTIPDDAASAPAEGETPEIELIPAEGEAPAAEAVPAE